MALSESEVQRQAKMANVYFDVTYLNPSVDGDSAVHVAQGLSGLNQVIGLVDSQRVRIFMDTGTTYTIPTEVGRSDIDRIKMAYIALYGSTNRVPVVALSGSVVALPDPVVYPGL